MARGTTADLTASGTVICTQALYEIAVYDPNDSIPAADLADALVVLNFMVKEWYGSPNIVTKGLKTWLRTRQDITLTAKISFDLKISGGDCDIYPPIDILSATLKDTDGNETVLTKMLVEEFEAIANKSSTNTGSPLKWYYEPGYQVGTFFLDIIPSDTTDVVDILYLRPIYDFDALANDADFPQHWYTALYSNLAVRLGARYGKMVYDETKELARNSLAMAQLIYPENANIGFEPGRD